eukprot:10339873-Karenia_brevis.AAC.1
MKIKRRAVHMRTGGLAMTSKNPCLGKGEDPGGEDLIQNKTSNALLELGRKGRLLREGEGEKGRGLLQGNCMSAVKKSCWAQSCVQEH